MMNVCPACDGTRTSVGGDDGDRNIYEPCMYCDGKGEIEIVGDGRHEEENTDCITNGNRRESMRSRGSQIVMILQQWTREREGLL